MGSLLERPVDPNQEECVLRLPRDLALGACLACLAHGDTLPPDKSHNRLRQACQQPRQSLIWWVTHQCSGCSWLGEYAVVERCRCSRAEAVSPALHVEGRIK